MHELNHFSPEQLDIVNNAVAMAEELVSNHYKMSASQWLGPRYDVKTLVEQFANLLQLPEKTVDIHKDLLEKRFGENLWSRFSMTGWVKNLDIPGLIIHDEEDSYVRVDDGKLIARTWPNSELLLTTGLGHNRILISRTVLDRLGVFLEPLLA
mgnify:CR=1 FL=1